MRYVLIFMLVLFLTFLGIFAVQNMQMITIKLFDRSFQAPIALLSVAIYFLGMFSGGSLVAFLRHDP